MKVSTWYIGKKTPARDADYADYLARVRDGWMLQDVIRDRLEARNLITRGKHRDWLSCAGRAVLEANPRESLLDDVLDLSRIDAV